MYRGLLQSVVGWFPKGLQVFFKDMELWRREPPWSQGDLEALGGLLFGQEDKALLSEEFSLKGIESMFEKGNSWFIPGCPPHWIMHRCCKTAFWTRHGLDKPFGLDMSKKPFQTAVWTRHGRAAMRWQCNQG